MTVKCFVISFEEKNKLFLIEMMRLEVGIPCHCVALWFDCAEDPQG